MEKVKKLSARIAGVTKAVGCVSFVCVVCMMLLNVADVMLGKLWNIRIIGAYELTQRMLMCAVFTAFAYGQSRKSHICMTILIAKLPRAVRFSLFTLMSLLSAAAAGAMTWAAAAQARVSFSSGYMTEVLYIPLYPFYIVETLAMLIFTLVLLYDTALSAAAIFREDYARMIQSEWS